MKRHSTGFLDKAKNKRLIKSPLPVVTASMYFLSASVLVLHKLILYPFYNVADENLRYPAHTSNNVHSYNSRQNKNSYRPKVDLVGK